MACYFHLWADHNARVLEVGPTTRLLLVETSQILAKTDELAAWAGVPPETLRTERGWIFATPTKHHVLATLDRSYVQETADRICGPLMSRYFPEVSWP